MRTEVYIEVNGHGQYYVYHRSDHYEEAGPFDSYWDAADYCHDQGHDIVER